MVQVFGVDLGNRQTVAAEVAGELEEGDVLFAHWIENADGAAAGAASRTMARPEPPSWPWSGVTSLGGDMEVLLEEALKNVHE